jgi:hypothetical protein
MAAARPLTVASEQPAGRSDPDRTFVVGFALVLAVLSIVPYLLATLLTPSGHHFAGFFFIADDATTYLSKMREGAQGLWLWNDPYTSEAHTGVFLFGFYLLLGHLAALAHLPLLAMYHVAGISGAVALVLSVDRLAARLLPKADRRLGVVLAAVGSGWGFLAQVAGNPVIVGIHLQALDLHLPELSGWYSILAIPHFVWATALIVVSLLGLLSIADHASPLTVLRTGAALTALTAIHPQMIAVLGLIWLTYRGVLATWGDLPDGRTILAEAAAFVLCAPLLAYNAWVLFHDPTIAEWARQWRHQPPDPLSLGLGLGLPLGLAVVAIVVVWRHRLSKLALLAVWPPLVLVLLYLPNVANIQRRLLDALYVPIGLLAAVGLRLALERLRPRRRARLRRLLVPACCVSSLLVMAIALRFATGAFPEMYVSASEWQAMSWLSQHHQATDRALSSPQVGLFLPAWAGVPVYVGHYSETLDYFAKISTENGLLRATTTPADFAAFTHANGITLLYWGPDERQGRDFDPSRIDTLALIYQVSGVQIYRIGGGS